MLRGPVGQEFDEEEEWKIKDWRLMLRGPVGQEFDEEEEWKIKAAHYFVLYAENRPATVHSLSISSCRPACCAVVVL